MSFTTPNTAVILGDIHYFATSTGGHIDYAGGTERMRIANGCDITYSSNVSEL
jgi:hypothetical protein